VKYIFERLKREGGAYLRQLAASGPLPVIRGREVLFVFYDPERSVRHVRLVHHIATLERAPRLERLGRNGPFALHLVLPARARMEYTYGVTYADGSEEIRTDPFNPELAWCPFGPKSVVTTADYVTPSWAIHDPDVARGKLERITLPSAAMADERTFWIYTPAAAPPEDGYALLFIHDGNDYLDYSGITTVLDNLIARGLIAPVLCVLSKPELRNEEYTCTPHHPAFLVEELQPWVWARYPVTRDRERTGLLGASLGAVASVYTAYCHPERFGRLLLQSGSFIFQRAVRAMPLFEPIDELDRVTMFLEGEFFPRGFARGMKIYHSCGTFESILSYNRSFAAELQALGHDLVYRESHDGHNWISWRDHLGPGLACLFPPEGAACGLERGLRFAGHTARPLSHSANGPSGHTRIPACPPLTTRKQERRSGR
jgi:enterochelin esterase family protein